MELKFKVPKELEGEVRKLSQVELSLILAGMIKSEFEKAARLKQIVSKSRLTEEQAINLGKQVNKSLHKRYKKLYPELQ